MGKKKTQEEFENELKLVIPSIQVIGNYINSNTKIKCKCLIHNHMFDAYPSSLLKGHGCKKCGYERLSKMRTKTHEQFVEDLKSVNADIEVIGKYTNMDTKVRVKCLIDGYEWNADPRKLLRGSRCAVCTNHKVMAGVNDVATTRYDLIKYFKYPSEATKFTSGSEKYVDIICPNCGYEDTIRIGNLSRFGYSCPQCYENKYGRKRVPKGYWNNNTMEEYLSKNYPGYRLLDIQYPSDDDCGLKVYITCPNDLHAPYWVYWTNIIAGYKCQKCYYEENNKTKWTAENAYEYFKHNGYVMLDKDNFVNSDKSVPCYDKDKFLYMINVWNMKKYEAEDRTYFSKFQNNPYAIYNVKLFCKLYRPDYDIVSEEYIGANELYTFYYNGEFDDHCEHTREFTTSINSFVNAFVKHPLLNKSNGERSAENILKKHNITYEPQKRFDDCRDSYTLPFDLYLPDYNLIIEIMGEQHERPVELFGGQEGFEKRIVHDKIKRDYLKQNNINILDIWYYEFNKMEELILEKIQSILIT